MTVVCENDLIILSQYLFHLFHWSLGIRTTLNEEFELSQATKRLNVLSLGDYCDHRRRKNFGMLQKLRARRKYS